MGLENGSQQRGFKKTHCVVQLYSQFLREDYIPEHSY